MLAVTVVQIIIVEVSGGEQCRSEAFQRSQVKSADISCSNWLLSTFFNKYVFHFTPNPTF